MKETPYPTIFLSHTGTTFPWFISFLDFPSQLLGKCKTPGCTATPTYSFNCSTSLEEGCRETFQRVQSRNISLEFLIGPLWSYFSVKSSNKQNHKNKTRKIIKNSWQIKDASKLTLWGLILASWGRSMATSQSIFTQEKLSPKITKGFLKLYFNARKLSMQVHLIPKWGNLWLNPT